MTARQVAVDVLGPLAAARFIDLVGGHQVVSAACA